MTLSKSFEHLSKDQTVNFNPADFNKIDPGNVYVLPTEGPIQPSEYRKSLLDKYQKTDHYNFIKKLIDKNINTSGNRYLVSIGMKPYIGFLKVVEYFKKNNISNEEVKKDIFKTACQEMPGQALRALDQVDDQYRAVILTTVFEKNPHLFIEQSTISDLNNQLGTDKTNEWLKKINESVLKKIAKNNPEYIFNNFMFFLKEEYAKKIITLAKKKFSKHDQRKSPLTELFMVNDSTFELYKYITKNECKLTIGNKAPFSIKPEQYSIISGLSNAIDKKNLDVVTDEDIKVTILEYQNILNKYIEDHEGEQETANKTTAFLLWNEKDSDASTLSSQRQVVKQDIENRHSKVIDYGENAGTRKELGNNETIGTKFADQVESFIKDNILHKYPPNFLKVYIGLHGQPDGTAIHGENFISMKEFEALWNITSKFTEEEKNDFLKRHKKPLSCFISYEIRSCFSGYKFDEKKNEIGNISMSSSQQRSTTDYTNTYFTASEKKDDGSYNADFDGNGYLNSAEIKVRQMLHYTGSIIKTTYQKENGEHIVIS